MWETLWDYALISVDVDVDVDVDVEVDVDDARNWYQSRLETELWYTYLLIQCKTIHW